MDEEWILRAVQALLVAWTVGRSFRPYRFTLLGFLDQKASITGITTPAHLQATDAVVYKSLFLYMFSLNKKIL